MNKEYQNVNVVRNYKDTVFRMLFNSKKELLLLYNALNDTKYTNEDELEIVTLINPNTPLRFLMYITRQLEKLIVKKNLYGSKLIELPNPRFFVFYNGKEAQPEKTELPLSSSYKHKTDDVNLELKVLQLNINKGYNEEVKRKCPTLFQYMQYVDVVHDYLKSHSLEEAVPFAVDYCIKHDILKDFLLANKAEVISMSIFEFDEELYKKSIREEGYEDGYNAGVEESKKTIAQKDETIVNMQAELESQRAEIEQLKKLLKEKQ
ncbi:MAG: hypothetical protein IJV15_01950 [Lachnospiraceae bacterium]|nr:hypothetical protein [Lachnospiraceae bacterium]